MAHKQFPKWMYHRSEPAKVVQSQEELEELGDDWVDTPAALKDEPRKSNAAAGPDVDPDNDGDEDEDGDEDVDELEPAPAGSGKRKPTKRK